VKPDYDLKHGIDFSLNFKQGKNEKFVPNQHSQIFQREMACCPFISPMFASQS
jgi:hypothetical protein